MNRSETQALIQAVISRRDGQGQSWAEIGAEYGISALYAEAAYYGITPHTVQAFIEKIQATAEARAPQTPGALLLLRAAKLVADNRRLTSRTWKEISEAVGLPQKILVAIFDARLDQRSIATGALYTKHAPPKDAAPRKLQQQTRVEPLPPVRPEVPPKDEVGEALKSLGTAGHVAIALSADRFLVDGVVSCCKPNLIDLGACADAKVRRLPVGGEWKWRKKSRSQGEHLKVGGQLVAAVAPTGPGPRAQWAGIAYLGGQIGGPFLSRSPVDVKKQLRNWLEEIEAMTTSGIRTARE